jgi:hypothetical protein
MGSLGSLRICSGFPKAFELGSARMPRPPLAHRPPCSIFAASIHRPSAKQGSFSEMAPKLLKNLGLVLRLFSERALILLRNQSALQTAA